MLVQKRNYTSRGCFACIRRKIKCDEHKPCCNKCAQYGNPCPGYRQQDELQFRNSLSAGKASRTTLSQRKTKPSFVQNDQDQDSFAASFFIGHLRPALSTYHNAQEAKSLHYFRTLAAHDLQGYCRSDFWSSTIYQRSLSLPAVHYALLAVSDAHREWVQDPTAPLSQSTLAKYGNALRATIAETKTAKSYETYFVSFYSCILLYFFELLKRDSAAANVHLDNGLRFLREWYTASSIWPPAELSPSDRSIFYQLLYTLGRLDVERSLTGIASQHFVKVSRILYDGLRLALAGSSNVFSLGCHLLFLTRDTVHFTLTNVTFNEIRETLVPKTALDERDRLVLAIDALVDTLDKTQDGIDQKSMLGRQSMMAIHIVRLYLMANRFRLTNIFAISTKETGPQNGYASKMLDCADMALRLRCTPPLRQGFMPQPGIIAPMRMLVSEAQDQKLRFRALAVVTALSDVKSDQTAWAGAAGQVY